MYFKAFFSLKSQSKRCFIHVSSLAVKKADYQVISKYLCNFLSIFVSLMSTYVLIILSKFSSFHCTKNKENCSKIYWQFGYQYILLQINNKMHFKTFFYSLKIQSKMCFFHRDFRSKKVYYQIASRYFCNFLSYTSIYRHKQVIRLLMAQGQV